MEVIKLCTEGSCTNCTACLNICPISCITMNETFEGFKYPEINSSKCIKCKKCINVCPELNNPQYNDIGSVYSAWSNNNYIRTSSSSGGIFTEIAKLFLENNDSVFASAFDKDLNLEFSECNSLNDLDKYKGSKYVQSELGDTYININKRLDEGKKVLFVGTPCQVSGLNFFLDRKYDNLLTIDLICHGVPSQKLFLHYLSLIKLSKKRGLNNFSFRYEKGQGFELKSNFKKVNTANSFYMTAYKKNLMHMKTCYSCKYARPQRVSDITLGDFWGIQNNHENAKRNKGISLILVNSEQGQKALNSIKSNIDCYENDINEAIQGNTNLKMSSHLDPLRETFYYDFYKLSKNEIINKYNLKPSFKDYIRPIKRIIEELIYGK